LSKKDYNLFKPRKDSSYEFIDLNKGSINPYAFLGIRARHYLKDIFFKHPIYETISQKILNDAFTFITGNPLAGKTRIVYDTLSLLKNKTIIIPKAEAWINEYHLPSRNDLIVFIDELDVFCEKNPVAINKLLHYANERDIKCVITCRTGPELAIVKSIINHHTFLELIRNKIHIPRFDKADEKFKEFLNQHQSKINDTRNFDGNMGSLILPLVDMKKRFQSLVENEHDLAIAMLKGLKLHYHLYNYEAKKSYYDESKIRIFCNKYLQDEATNVEWENAKKQILSTETNLNFIDEDDYMIIEEAYLDCHEDSSRDVVDDSFNVNKIKRTFKDLYKDPYESKILGFLTSINDWNRLLAKQEIFEEAYKIFKQIPETIKHNKQTYSILMFKTEDKEIQKELFQELKSKNLDSLHTPNNLYFGNFNSFKELLEAISKLSKKHLYSKNGATTRLLKLAVDSPKESLSILFKKYPKDHIYSNFTFMEICLKCCKDEEDYRLYVEPYISSAPKLDKLLLKSFIRLCSKLMQKQVALKLLEENFNQDDSYYCNEKGNCIKDSQPYDALNYYLLGAEKTTNKRHSAMSYTNYGNLIYEKQLRDKLHLGIETIFKAIKSLKLSHNDFPYLRYTLLLLIIWQTPIEELIIKIEQLLNRPDIMKGTIKHVLEHVKDIEKQILLREYFDPREPMTKEVELPIT
jgi:hypothetical protein